MSGFASHVNCKFQGTSLNIFYHVCSSFDSDLKKKSMDILLVHGRYGQITFQIKMLEQLAIYKQNSGFSHLTQKLTQRPKHKA